MVLFLNINYCDDLEHFKLWTQKMFPQEKLNLERFL